MEIIKNDNPKFYKVDFENLSFGETFTDHMFICDFLDGNWVDPKIIPYQNISIDPSTSALHYGQAIFEGMKAYKDHNDKVWLFRPEDNFERLNKSCKRMKIPEIPKDIFMNGLKKLVSIDSDWVKSGNGNSLYIRPFVFASQATVQASPSSEYKFIIICSPAKSYYKESKFSVLISEKYSRASSGGVGFAKAAGNYGSSFYPTSIAQNKGYHQIIWTDSNEHKFIEEAGTMNIFFRIENKLITAPTNDRILDGITRKSVIQIAKDIGLDVEVRPFTVDELVAAVKNKSLKEIFGAGTAVVILSISGFGYKNIDYDIKPIKESYAEKIKKIITDIQYNRSDDKFGWRSEV